MDKKSFDTRLNEFEKDLQKQVDHLTKKEAATPVAENNKISKIQILKSAQMLLNAFRQGSDKVQINRLDSFLGQIKEMRTSLSKISHVGTFNKMFSTPSSTQTIFDQFLKDARAYLPDKKAGKPGVGPR